MKYASYRPTDNKSIPVVVSLGEMETPVWLQQDWESGEYAQFVVRNGCGHCCAAMALRMHGVDIDPHGEYELCVKLWGHPEIVGHEKQANFQSVDGIAKVIRHHGITAESFGVPDRHAAMEHICECLRAGKLVIFESHPTADFPDNPFSTGEHWVMAVGYTEDGEILVANSSRRATEKGYQLVDEDTVRRALYLGASPEDYTWGEWRDEFRGGVGYVVVG